MQDGGAFGVAFDRHCSKNVTLQLNRDSHFPDLAHFDGSAARIRNLIFEASCTAASILLGTRVTLSRHHQFGCLDVAQ